MQFIKLLFQLQPSRLCSPSFCSASGCLACTAGREWPGDQQDGGSGGTVLAPGFRERPMSSCPPQLPWENPVEPVYGTGRHIDCPHPLRSQHQLSSDPSSASGPLANSSEFVRLSNSRVFPCSSVVRVVAVGSLHPSVAFMPSQ